MQGTKVNDEILSDILETQKLQKIFLEPKITAKMTETVDKLLKTGESNNVGK